MFLVVKCFVVIMCCFSALIKLLQESVGIETCSPQFLELIMKVNNSACLNCIDVINVFFIIETRDGLLKKSN